MKILILANKPPYPPTEGGPIAMDMIIQGLISDGHQVKVLAFNTSKTLLDPGCLPPDYLENTQIEFIPVDLSIKPFNAFLNLFTSRSYHVERFISRAFDEKLKEVLSAETYDVVQFEMIYMAPYLKTVRKFSKAKTVLRAHNIEHLIWERVAQTSSNMLKRIYLHHLVRTLKKYELSILDKFDGIAAITEKDASFFRRWCKVPVEAIPFGIDPGNFPIIREEPEFPSLFSIGSMDWLPNAEGVRWFLDKAWPLIHEKFPELKYYIAGRHMPQWITCCGRPNVMVVGEVKNAKAFMGSKSVMIVPLFSGSGIRIKIIEGLATGKTIISTTIGAEGIHITRGENILIADSPEEFLQAVTSCMNPDFCKTLGKHARELIEKEYQRKEIIGKLIAFYKKTGA